MTSSRFLTVGVTLCVAGALSGCSHSMEFHAFGEYRPDVEARVVQTYSHTQKGNSPPVPAGKVTVYRGMMPPGIKYDNGSIKILPSSRRIILGTFKWVGSALLPKESEVAGELAKIALAAGGNELVLIDIHEDRGYVHRASGLVILHRPEKESDVLMGNAKPSI